MATSNLKYPKITFIIPTLNALKHLPNLIKSIESQNYPKNLVEIIISDGGSTDGTIKYCQKKHLRVLNNPEIIHEPGKSIASKFAQGNILFYTDADNYLATPKWIKLMTQPYLDNPKIRGFLPQTEAPPDSSPINRYFGYLYTDPFSWFVYQNGANPKDYQKLYQPRLSKNNYQIYQFSKDNPPLFGLSQGVGIINTFKRDNFSQNDDILAGLALIRCGSLIAYVPRASLYHYHIDSFPQFISKYTWRIRNNLNQNYRNMGFTQRKKYLSKIQLMRAYLFIPYTLSLIFPLLDATYLSFKYRNLVMFWHLPVSITLALIMIKESIQKYIFRLNIKLNQYE
jgi:glycosyltransferase involved in cell wall biosynthesis